AASAAGGCAARVRATRRRRLAARARCSALSARRAPAACPATVVEVALVAFTGLTGHGEREGRSKERGGDPKQLVGHGQSKGGRERSQVRGSPPGWPARLVCHHRARGPNACGRKMFV